jgi:hypothetical protein
VQRPGRGLEPRFHVDDDVFARERVFAGLWSRDAVPATLLPPEAAVDHLTRYLDRMSA